MAAIDLPFNRGLDRYSGVTAVQRGTFEDLRNVMSKGGRILSRPGTIQIATLPDVGGSPCSRVCHIQPLRSLNETVIVGYYSQDRKVHVFRAGPDGSSPVHIEEWFTLSRDAIVPPIITGCETYNMVFLAHDEPVIGRRAATKTYGTGGFQTLQADFRGTGDEDVKFRGIYQWSVYVVGWGFRNTTENGRNILRISLPNDPTQWINDHYFIAGNPGMHIVGVGDAGGSLVVHKEQNSYTILGQSSLNFGIIPLSHFYGALGSGVSVSVGPYNYSWGLGGPWRTDASRIQDVEHLLNIDRLSPENLPVEGNPLRGFGLYLQDEKVIEWYFGRRIYSLDIETEELLWGYRDRSIEAACGNIIPRVGADFMISNLGYPRIDSVDSLPGNKARVNLTNVNHAADEVIEVWMRRPNS